MSFSGHCTASARLRTPAISSPAAVVVVIERMVRDISAATTHVRVLLVTLWLLRAEAVIHHDVVLVHTTLHLRLAAAARHRESGRCEQRSSNMCRALHRLAPRS